MLNRNERAALFCPFDALKGLQELLRNKERIIVQPKSLSEDECVRLNHKIHQIRPGMLIRVVYYDQNDYVLREGLVSKIDLEFSKTLWIVQEKIAIQNIVEIEWDGDEEF